MKKRREGILNTTERLFNEHGDACRNQAKGAFFR